MGQKFTIERRVLDGVLDRVSDGDFVGDSRLKVEGFFLGQSFAKNPSSEFGKITRELGRFIFCPCSFLLNQAFVEG
jgi:hypothetical protein